MHIRLDGLTKLKLERAAAYTQKSLSDFVLGQALHAADEVIPEHETVTLNEADWGGVSRRPGRSTQAQSQAQTGLRRTQKTRSSPKEPFAWNSSLFRSANSTSANPSTAANLPSTDTSMTTPARTSGDESTGYSPLRLQIHRGRSLGITASAPAASMPLTCPRNSDAAAQNIRFRWSCWVGWPSMNPIRARGLVPSCLLTPCSASPKPVR